MGRTSGSRTRTGTTRSTARYAAERGGRWNPPESFPVVYLCRSVAVARANVYRRLERQPYGPEDLRPGAGPVLVRTTVPEDRYLNVVTDAGCRDAGLPTTYPRDGRRRIVPHSRCQPIGLRAQEAGLPGVAARSAVGRRRGARLLREDGDSGEAAVRVFEDWFWDGGASLTMRQ